MPKEDLLTLDGQIDEILPDGRFGVLLENDHRIIAYTAGKMRKYRIRSVIGDRVRVEMTPYDPRQGADRLPRTRSGGRDTRRAAAQTAIAPQPTRTKESRMATERGFYLRQVENCAERRGPVAAQPGRNVAQIQGRLASAGRSLASIRVQLAKL